jgi:hypothetical protein
LRAIGAACSSEGASISNTFMRFRIGSGMARSSLAVMIQITWLSVDRNFREFVHERLRGVVFQQAVERTERVVLRVGAGLVDLVDHDHGGWRTGLPPVHRTPCPASRPSIAKTRPTAASRGHRAHRHEAHAGSEQVGELAREVGLADAGGPSRSIGVTSRPSRESCDQRNMGASRRPGASVKLGSWS